ncbi:MAG: hypothetical protein WCF18_13460, partial [Chthoniobacteraceae bacterium]
LAHLACAFYWPNPLVWLAARSLRTVQEQATDDLVLRGGTAPEEYAEQLYDVARALATQRRLARHAVAMASPSTLERRMLAIVDEQRDRRPLSLRAVLGGMLAVALMLGLSTAAQLQAEENKAAGESAAPAARFGSEQITIAAKFVEISATAEPKKKSSALSAIFTDGPVPRAPSGSLGLSGVFTAPQFALVEKELNALKGVDLLSSPRITTRSGQRAMIEIVREFRYPTEYEKDGDGWKPKNFATRNTGITFEVLAVASPEGTLDLELTPSVVEFLGWIDLDNGTKYPAITKPNASTLDRFDATTDIPPGRRVQPVFSERKLTSTVTIWPGQTVVLGTLGETAQNKDFPRKGPARRLAVFVTASLVKEAPLTASRTLDATGDVTIKTPEATSRTAAAEIPPKPKAAADSLASIIIPRIDFRDATLSEAVAFLVAKGRAAGTIPVNIVVPQPPVPVPMITMSMTNMPLPEAVQYVASLAGLQVRRDANAFILEKPSDSAPAGPAAEIPSDFEAGATASAALQKARSIVIPRIVFEEATVARAIDFLRVRATELDPETDPTKRGVNIFLLDPTAASATARITINLTNVPLSEALRYVAGLSGLELAAEPAALVLRAKSSGVAAKTPDANWVPGKPGFVTSPHAPHAGYIDVRGLKAGTEVKDPYSEKRFRVPEVR